MSDAQAERGADAGAAGRGGIFVLGAKVFFIVIGFVQQALLKAVLGLAEYGALARVLSPANIVNNVVVQGSIQGVSRRVAPARERFRGELAAAMRVHAPIAVVLGASFALFAGPFSEFQRSPHIATPLRVMAIVALAYGFYAPLVGTINGRSLFGRQAMLDVLFATLRTAGLVGLGWLFVKRGASGTLGATVGFAAAAALITPLAAVWALRGGRASALRSDGASSIAASAYLGQLLTVALAQFLVNSLMQADLSLVGRFLSDGALSAGLEPAAARFEADEWVGVYRACQLFAFLPYQLVLSVAQVLFPMVARAHADGDRAAVALTVGRGMRIAAIMAGLIVAIVIALPGTLLHFAYGATVAARGALALRVLAVGQGAFALFGVASTVLVSLGQERRSVALSGAALVLVGAACFAFAQHAAFGAPQLVGTATATSLGLFAALALAAVVVRRVAGAFVPIGTALRVFVAVAVVASAGARLPDVGRALAPFAALGVATIYLCLLVLLRELGATDLNAVKSILRLRR